MAGDGHLAIKCPQREWPFAGSERKSVGKGSCFRSAPKAVIALLQLEPETHSGRRVHSCEIETNSDPGKVLQKRDETSD